MSKQIQLVFGIVIIALADQMVGWWARHALAGNHIIWLCRPIVSLHLLYNRGAMLGVFSNHPLMVALFGLFATAALIIASVAVKLWPLSIMAGGAVGNTMSRWMFGKVTDYVRIAGYPGVFNLADVALRVGVVWLIVALLIGAKRTPKGEKAE